MSAKPPVTLQHLLDYLPKAVSAAADENNHQQTPYRALTDKAITYHEPTPGGRHQFSFPPGSSGFALRRVGSCQLQANKAHLHYESGGFDIDWTRK
ncbi:MAG: hypothetical protein KF760_34310 [Candidatus Eremiobacteraeota bacterium]|nr:hypothetical protein [Candidatus Eremiobacteraeota bacterium]MCW5871344.1 hypothetical protein [Candidatus Eremiobacteraeota bacterium]